ERDGGIRAKLFNFEIGKRKSPHLGAIAVFLEITIANRLPPAHHFITRNKNSGVGASVTIHETINIAAVPSLLLRAQNGANFRNNWGIAGFLVCCVENRRAENENQGYPERLHCRSLRMSMR